MQYKMLVLGDYGTGKTAVFKQFLKTVPGAEMKPSIRLELIEFVRPFKGEKVTINLFDIPGRELSSDRRKKLYLGTHGAFIIYDITSPHSFRHAPFWIEELNNYSGFGKLPIVLVGNKNDLRATSDRVLNPIDAKQFVFRLNRTTKNDEIENHYFEFSAKVGRGLVPIVDKLIVSIYRHQQSLKKK